MSHPPPNEAIQTLEEVLGSESTREVVRIFLSEFPDTVRQMSSAESKEQLRLVHGMKSSALHMGAVELCRRMTSLEKSLMAEGGSMAPADLAGAIADFARIEPALRKYSG